LYLQALTATWTGRPRAVIASSWRQDETQEWKVKSKKIGKLKMRLTENVQKAKHVYLTIYL
jgi:hypothetical protein